MALTHWKHGHPIVMKFIFKAMESCAVYTVVKHIVCCYRYTCFHVASQFLSLVNSWPRSVVSKLLLINSLVALLVLGSYASFQGWSGNEAMYHTAHQYAIHIETYTTKEW